MKISFITTVLNEEKNIDELLESLNSQSLLPDEAVIVDALSKDKTIDKILKFQKSKKNKLKIKLITAKVNRSAGRNTAVENASGEIIVCTDAGCVPDKNWIKNLIESFKGDVDVVSGYYKTNAKNDFEKALTSYTSVMPDQIDVNNFLPSSRSVAFKKSAWKRVGGYPEFLETCEDLYFARKLKNSGFKFAFAKDAAVFWPQRENIWQAGKQFFEYAVGDGIARYFRNTTPILFGRYLFGLTLLLIALVTDSLFLFVFILFLLVSYILWSILKNYRYVKSWRAIYLLPLLQFVADFSVLIGTTLGFARSFFIKR